MEQTLEQKLIQLTKLLETAQNPKILLEEMRIVSQKTFEVNGQIAEMLDAQENSDTTIAQLQSTFNTREMVWDIVEKIEAREMEIAAKTHQKCHKDEQCSCTCDDKECSCKTTH